MAQGEGMSVYKDSRGRWHVSFQQGGIRRHRVCPPYTTKAQATEYETKLRREVFRVDKLGGLPEYSLQQAIDRYLDEYRGKDKERTAGKARAFEAYVSGRALVDVCGVADDVARDGSVSQSTRNRRLAILRRTANLAYKRWGWLSEPIGDKIQLLPENNHREVYLSEEGIKQLADAQENIQKRAAIYILSYSGLRLGELLNINPETDLRDDCFVVRESKSGKPRMVPIAPKVRPWLKYLPIGLHPSTISHAVSRTMPGVRAHDLRHTFASLFLEHGGDLYSLCKILGHHSIQMTQRYAHLQTESLKKAMRRLK